jgi:hypothetical protein
LSAAAPAAGVKNPFDRGSYRFVNRGSSNPVSTPLPLLLLLPPPSLQPLASSALPMRCDGRRIGFYGRAECLGGRTAAVHETRTTTAVFWAGPFGARHATRVDAIWQLLNLWNKRAQHQGGVVLRSQRQIEEVSSRYRDGTFYVSLVGISSRYLCAHAVDDLICVLSFRSRRQAVHRGPRHLTLGGTRVYNACHETFTHMMIAQTANCFAPAFDANRNLINVQIYTLATGYSKGIQRLHAAASNWHQASQDHYVDKSPSRW